MDHYGQQPGTYPTNDGYREPRPGMGRYQQMKSGGSAAPHPPPVQPHMNSAAQNFGSSRFDGGASVYSSGGMSQQGGDMGMSYQGSGGGASTYQSHRSAGSSYYSSGPSDDSSSYYQSSRDTSRMTNSMAPRYTQEAVQMLLDRYPVYQIDFDVVNCGLRIVTSKRRLRWRFGFPNQEALELGRQGTACRGQEHDIIVLWSVTSGKRLITADGQEVTQFTDRSGVLEYSWRMFGQHIIKIVAHASPPLTKKPGFRQYALYIDGKPFHRLPKVYELGQWGPGMPLPQINSSVGYMQPQQRPATEEEIQAHIAAAMAKVSMNTNSMPMPMHMPPPVSHPPPPKTHSVPDFPPVPPPNPQAPAPQPVPPMSYAPVPPPAPAPVPEPAPCESNMLVPVGFVPCPVINEEDEDAAADVGLPPLLQLTDGTPIEELDKLNHKRDPKPEEQMLVPMSFNFDPYSNQSNQPPQPPAPAALPPPPPPKKQPQVQRVVVTEYKKEPSVTSSTTSLTSSMIVEDIDDSFAPPPTTHKPVKPTILIEDIDDSNTQQVVKQGLQQMQNAQHQPNNTITPATNNIQPVTPHDNNDDVLAVFGASQELVPSGPQHVAPDLNHENGDDANLLEIF